jgi:hypothetical protein
MGDNFFLIF